MTLAKTTWQFFKLLQFLAVLLIVAIPLILAMILLVAVLFLPLGIVGLIFATLENRKYKFFMSARYLRYRKVNIISSIAISVGVMALIVVYSIMSGFQDTLRQSIRGTYAHIMVQSAAPWGPDPADFVEEVKKFPHVISVSPRVTGIGMLAFSRKDVNNDVSRRGINIIGVDVASESSTDAFRKTLTSVPKDTGLQVDDVDHPFAIPPNLVQGGREIPGLLIGQRLLERLRVFPGETIKLFSAVFEEDEQPKARDRRFQIAGGFRSEMYDFEISSIFIPYQEARDFLRSGGNEAKAELYVTLDDYSYADEVQALIQKEYRLWQVQTWEDRQANFLRAVETEKRIMMVILCFIVIIAAGLILATLTLMVMEKVRDIGIMKALGGTTQGIMSIFLMNGFLIGALGAVLGLILGVIVSSNINPIHDLVAAVVGFRVFDPRIYVFDEIPIRFEPVTIGLFLLGTVLASLAASLWPSFKAARMNPVESLRYE